MTDNEIIKALECCTQHQYHCPKDCPVYEYDNEPCDMHLMKNALDLINRQKAKLENWQKKYCELASIKNDEFSAMIKEYNKTQKLRNEAIKKFAHQVKILLETRAKLYSLSDKDCEFAIVQSTALKTVDDLVKEMTENCD